jgi:hypothetical protein
VWAETPPVQFSYEQYLFIARKYIIIEQGARSCRCTNTFSIFWFGIAFYFLMEYNLDCNR